MPRESQRIARAPSNANNTPSGDEATLPAGAATATAATTGSSPPARTAASDGTLAVDDPDRYELAGEHARGGLGRVVRAVDRRLGRTVAVKELLKQSELAESLFVREALITARLQHPGIVPVHEAGRWPTGEPYYVMKLVEGRTLKELIAETKTTRERLALLAPVIAVADAVGYAHSEQVIHRDIKPSNVIVGGHGETVVVDWGLARDGRRDVPEIDLGQIASSSGGLRPGSNGDHGPSTVSGRVIGTPAYMPPEQGRGEVVDERADVYAIGAVLYEVLTGAPPYEADTPKGILDLLLAGPPRPLADLAPHVPPDLVAIVVKAMARDRSERYRTARELAADLRRFSNGQLVTAHHYGTMLLARRWLARHRGAVAVAGIAAAALLAVGVASLRRVVDERNLARTERGRAVAAARAAEDRQAELVRLQARTSLRRDPTAAVAWLKAYPAAAPHQEELAGLVDEAVALGVSRHVLRHGAWVLDAVFSPDGSQIATATRDGAVRLFSVATGAGRELGSQAGSIESIAFSPDGQWIAAGGDRVMLWPVGDGTPRSLIDSPGKVERLAFSPDGKLLLVVRDEEPLIVVEVANPTAKSEVQVPKDAFRVAFAADHWQTVLAASVDGVISSLVPTPKPIAKVPRGVTAFQVDRGGTRWAAYDGDTIWTGAVAGGQPTAIGRFPGPAHILRISDDARWIVLGGENHDVWLYDTIAREERLLRGHNDALYAFAFSPDGRRMVSASDDGTARVWDLIGGHNAVLRGHDDDVTKARFSPDGNWVITASFDGSVRLWDVRGLGVKTYGPDAGPILGMRIAGDTAITVGRGFASRWNLTTGERTAVLALPPEGPRKSYWKAMIPRTTPDGKVVATIGDDDTIVVDRAGASRQVLRGHTGWIYKGELAEDGKTLYSASRDGTLRMWDVAKGTNTVLYRAKTGIQAMALAKDGRVSVYADGALVELGADGGSRPVGNDCTRALVYDDHGRLIVLRCNGSAGVSVPGVGIVDLEGASYVVHISASPDGKRLAGSLNDRTVMVWDAKTGARVAHLKGHSDLVLGTAWAPDGERLATASYDHTVRVWDVSDSSSRVLRGHTAAVDSVAWIDNGARLVSAARDSTLRVWDAPSKQPPSPAEVRRVLEQVTTAQIGSGDRPTTTVTTPFGKKR